MTPKSALAAAAGRIGGAAALSGAEHQSDCPVRISLASPKQQAPSDTSGCPEGPRGPRSEL